MPAASLGFLGEYEHSLDEKGRLTVPIRFRADLGDTFIVTRGLDGCLFAYALPAWETIAGQIGSLSFTAAVPRNFQRLFFSGAAEVAVDRQGRVLLPAGLRQYAGLDKDAVLIGVSSRVEIWSKDRWAAFCADAEPTYQQLAEDLYRS